jgi:hypothetical protein
MGHGDKRGGVAARGEYGNLPTLEVGRVDWAFFSASEYRDDTAEGCGILKKWQEVDDESSARIVYQGCGEVEAFWSLCMRARVRHF